MTYPKLSFAMDKKLAGRKRGKKFKNIILFDIQEIKKVIKKDLYSLYSSSEINNIDNKNKINKEEEINNLYHKKYLKYMIEDFNSRIVDMIIIYIRNNKSFPLKYEKESNFISKFINLIKHLLMNEFEISYFTIILDKIGWKWKKLEHWTYFCILGIYTKKLCNIEEDSLLINIISRNYPKFKDYYENCISDKDFMNLIHNLDIDVKQINERFRLLNKPINSYCRKDIINLNEIVDKIVKLSHPYRDDRKRNKLIDNEEVNSNNGIINNNELKLNIQNNLSQFDYILLKNDLIEFPKIFTCFQRNKKIDKSNSYNNGINIEDINSDNISYLDLSYSHCSEFSINLDYLNNI